MRFKPWMLTPQSKTNAGPWGSLPPVVLESLKSSEQSPMVQGYLVRRRWPGAQASSTVLTETTPEQSTGLRPEPLPIPEPTARPATTTTSQANSSLSLTLRLVQPPEQQPGQKGIRHKYSRWYRFLIAMKRRAA